MTMATGRVDVHSHLLPGIDDGCETLEESVACAKELVTHGYTHSFCTPHVTPQFPAHTVEFVTARVVELQAELERARVPLTLLPGGEINLWPDIATTMDNEQVLTFAMARRTCLVDLWADRLPPTFADDIRWLQGKGLRVILAHPERMKAVQDDPDLADRFAELGVMLQGNLQCIGDDVSLPSRRVAEKFLREGRYFMLGTDLHRLHSLPSRLRGLAVARKLVGEPELNRLTITNPSTLLEG